MGRLTFDGLFCDIAMCKETPGGTFCENGSCSQRKVWERLKEYEDLEEQGRLVVLPCKVGDTVYMPTGRWRMTGFESDVCDGFHIARDGVLQVKVKNNTGNHGTYGVPGKTVFLTSEEAERALADNGGSTNG